MRRAGVEYFNQPEIMNHKALAKEIHRTMKKWWYDLNTGKPIEYTRDNRLMMVITELSEAVEGIRKDLMDDHLPRFKMEVVEMADAQIRLLDLSMGFDIPLIECRDIFVWSGDKLSDIMQICRYVAAVGESESCEAVSLSIAIKSIESYCRFYKLNLARAMRAKINYNVHRDDHKADVRKLANGKKF